MTYYLLNSIPTVQVLKTTIGINEAHVLDFVNYVKSPVGSGTPAFWPGDTVEWYPDFVSGDGLEFFGTVISVKVEYTKRGEKQTYRAASGYRELLAYAATLNTGILDTYKLGANTKSGTTAPAGPDIFTHDVREAMELLMTDSPFAFDYATLAFAVGAMIGEISKAGATFDDWISELLSWSDQGFCYEYYNSGVGVPVFRFGQFKDYTNTMTFQIGDFGARVVPGGDPIVKSMTVDRKLQQPKIRKLVLEGAGIFRRYNAYTMGVVPAYQTVHPDRDPAIWRRARFPIAAFPFVTNRYIDGAGNIQDDVSMVMTIQDWPYAGGSSTITWNKTGGYVINAPGISGNLYAYTNDNYIELDWPWAFLLGKTLYGSIANFTAMTAPLTVEYDVGSSIVGGTKCEVYEDYFKFIDSSGSTLVDGTAALYDLLDQRVREVCGDYLGNLEAEVVLHLEDDPINVFNLGGVATNNELSGGALRQIVYDWQKREVNLSFSSERLGKKSEEIKADLRIKREARTDNFGYYQIYKPEFTSENLAGAFSGIKHIETGE